MNLRGESNFACYDACVDIMMLVLDKFHINFIVAFLKKELPLVATKFLHLFVDVNGQIL